MKKFAALLLTVALSGGIAFGQDFYDDIYYDASKEKEVKVKEKKKKVVYTEDEEFSGTKFEDYGGGRDVDEYNRRGGIYTAQDTVAKSKKSESDGEVFEYTERIERFDNPNIVKGSDDEDLKTLYYSGDVNIYIGNPNSLYTFDDFGFAMGYLAGSSSRWYWNHYYSPYYNRWGYWDPWYSYGWYDPYWGPGYWHGCHHHYHHCWYPSHYYPHYYPSYSRPVHHHYGAGGRNHFGGVSGYHYGGKGRVNRVQGNLNNDRNNIRRPNRTWNRGQSVGTSNGGRTYNGYRGGGNTYRGDSNGGSSYNRGDRYNSNREDRYNSNRGDRYNSNRGDRYNNRTEQSRPSHFDNDRGSGHRGGSSIGRGSYSGGGRGSFGGGSSSGHRGGRR